MVKKIVKFIFLVTLSSHNLQASDENFLTLLPKPVFYKILEFTDTQSIGRLTCLSKPIRKKLLKLNTHFMNKHKILDPEQVKLLGICMDDFCKKNKNTQIFNEKTITIRTSISPFCFSEYLIEETNKNEKLKSFMDDFIETLLFEQKNILVERQSMMIRKKILKPFFEGIINKKENQKWEQNFENELFTAEQFEKKYHPYYVLPFVFFLDCGVPVNYNIRNSMYSYSATPLETVAEKGLYNICRFLLKNGADVNFKAEKNHDFLCDSSLYLCILHYMDLVEQEENVDEVIKTIGLLIDWGANRDYKILFGQTIREYVNQYIKDGKILDYFKEEK